MVTVDGFKASRSSTSRICWIDGRVFDAAGGFNRANEMIWMHADEVDGFPFIP